ncbi:hypothetical protein A2870_01650 [Candidatus Curtissbacteria bacterium RIFCSPHIGHO2_01_FULL_41_11]|uniref:Uncharacterized protein n=1 Tax=Candidatus Curtissbacteria bacterium RIFCSPHIGHO2_01_FULL_41_11 TaxID=1797711 RepID=A0A1F5G383_9BACT|nr:MAG: hypothetical protein A2870_01650 [Candidatus Curtissbacteria bacterium RIFCSPHIGHO2_01_FULL_41_11]
MTYEIGVLKKRATEGFLLLGAKRVFVQAVFTISNIFLARLLFPADFGTYATVTFSLSVFAVFSDLGLSPSLIQKKAEIKSEFINSIFWVQLALGFVLFAVVFLSAGLISNFFNLGNLGKSLFQIASFVFIINPIDSVGSAILERNLKYFKLMVSEVCELLSGVLTTLVLVLSGYGVVSLVIGYVVSRFVASLVSYLFVLWPIRFTFEKSVIRSLLNFGLNFQFNVMLALFWGPFILLYLSKRVGVENLGYFQFAASLSVFPMAFSDIINRVIFPLSSRVQVKKEYFKKVANESILMISLTSIPMMALEIACARQLIHYFYTDKWIPSLPALYLGLLQMGIAAYTGSFSQLLLSRGKTSYLRNIGLFWAILTWILGPILIATYGFVGISISNLIVTTTGLIMFYKLRKIVDINLSRNVVPFLLISITAGLVTFILVNFFPQRIYYFLFSLSVGIFMFLALVVLFERKTVVHYLRLIWSVLVFESSK